MRTPLIAAVLAAAMLLAACGDDDDGGDDAAGDDRVRRDDGAAGATSPDAVADAASTPPGPRRQPDRRRHDGSTGDTAATAIAAGDRVAVAGAHRDALRHRCRRSGDRGRRPVELPARGRAADDRPLRVRAQHRGHRVLRARPRDRPVRQTCRRRWRNSASRSGSDSPPPTLDDAYAQIEQLGAATGHVAEAAEVVLAMQTDIAAIVESMPELRRAADRVPRARHRPATAPTRPPSSARCTPSSVCRTSPTGSRATTSATRSSAPR